MPMYVPVLLALVGGLLVKLLPFKARRARNIYIEIVTLLTSVLVFILIFTQGSQSVTLLRMTDTFSLRLKMDGLGKVFMALGSFLWPLATLYAFEYMKHEEREASFFTFYTMTFGVTLLVAMAGNLFTLYVFYECLTMVTLPLVVHKKDAKSVYAGRRYLCYSIGGAALGFVGLMFLNQFGGAGDFVMGGILNPEMTAGYEELLRGVFVLAFVGFSAKAAIFPLSGWLPLASVAPTPVTALLHAVAVVKAGAFSAMRLTYFAFGTELMYGTWAQTVVLCLTALTIVYGAVMAVREQHLKRRLAYSTVSNLSYVLFGVALMTQGGLVGALTHMVFHGVMKITLFYCAGAILIKTGREYVQEIRGLYRAMPFIVVVFTLAGVAMVGIPPFTGFISKWNLLWAASVTGQVGAYIGMGALITSSVLSAVYLLKPAATMLFMAPAPNDLALSRGSLDPTWRMKAPLALLCAVIVGLGVYSVPLIDFFSRVAAGIP